MQKQLAAFFEGISACGLLRADQLEQLRKWVNAEDAEPQKIARALVQHSWLTAYQVKMFWKGRGRELFLNQYVLMDRLGEGGMGEVYLAKHQRMDRKVALKVIRKERLQSPDAIKRFGREIQAAAQLTHENIVMAYDADQAADRHFFAMEYVEGDNLSKLVKDHGPMPVGPACDAIRQASLGLQHAVERGMVHRDIKPSNLLLTKKGVLKILDMGLARLLDVGDGEAESRITQEGFVVGTPDFLAPEQARNARTADIRADIYALGCTFYFLLIGEPPYKGGTPTEKVLRHTVDPVPPILRADVPPAVSAIIYRMMAKKPEERFQTPDAVAYALQPFIKGDIAALASRQEPAADLLDPLASQKHPALFSTGPAAPVAEARLQLRSESQFRLPPPRPISRPVKKSRNMRIAFAFALLALAILVGGVYLIFKHGEGQTGPALDPQYKNPFDMTLVLIPSGTFDMGSPNEEAGRSTDEGPVHAVKIAQPFYMGATEVTLKQYKAVLGRLPVNYKEEPADWDVAVAGVTINDADLFIKRLNKEDNNRKHSLEYRLPTEAEWEYACRAGGKSRFNTGDGLKKDQAYCNDPTLKSAQRVAQFSPNAWGLYDMHGNVAEWVSDYYDEFYYAGSPGDDPKGPERMRSVHVARGGSYLETADMCRSARRKSARVETRAPDLGFRVVLAPYNK